LKEVRDPEATRNRKVYVIDDSEASLVREIFRQFANGKGYGEIVAWLNREGHLTRRGGPWSRASLVDMLRNEKYSGTFTFRKGRKHNYHAKRDDTIRVPGAIPAIVDIQTWETVQSKLTSMKKVRSKPGPVLRGFVYCGDCGSKMYSSGANHRRYQCGRWYRKRDVKCISMSAAKAVGFVILYMKKLLNEDIDFEELAVGYNQQAAMADHDFRKSLEELEKKEADLVAKIARATRAIMEGSPLAEELERQSSIVSKELEETREKSQN
jgi:hypothetical protein